MKKLNMYCLSTNPNNLDIIQSLNYIPVGLGEKTFSKEWLRDNTGNNISKKNKYYGEYTFHYWLWKNYLNQMGNEWIGFCQYRKFWSLKAYKTENINKDSINTQVLKHIPKEFENYESILTEPIFVNQWKTMKFLKKGLKIFIKKPLLIFNKKKKKSKFSF